jgi:hypothetical protein
MEDRFGLLDAVLTPMPISTRRFWGAHSKRTPSSFLPQDSNDLSGLVFLPGNSTKGSRGSGAGGLANA